MANATVTKGSIVEVSSNEPGFHGAWYVATLVDEVEASPTRKRTSNKKNRNKKKIGYLVKYDTLFEEDNLDEPLTEVVDPSFVRPLPPLNLRRNNDNNAKKAEAAAEEEGGGGGDFELYDVIDAYHRDGWWIGVVKKVIIEGEMRKYLVSFENPPEEVEFERSQLRLHVDWIDCRWLFPPKKIPEQELGDKNTTQTLESNNEAHSGFITPSKGDLTTDVENLSVGDQGSAKKKSRSRKKSESNSEMVGAVDGSVTYKRNKRIVNSVEKDSCGKRFQSSADIKGNTKVIVSVMETSGSDAIQRDLPLVEHEMIITETCEAEDGQSHQKRKRGRPPKLLVKTPLGLLQDGHEISSDLDEQPLSVWYQGRHPLSVLKRSSCFSLPDHHDESLNQAIVTSGETTTDYQQDWPFIKRSPIWAAIESLELYQTPTQKPHFSPLKKMKEDYREGLAIAHMVTFGNLVQRISDIQLTDPTDIINNSLETLVDLETHGFDVGAFRGRLNELLSLKSKVGQHVDKLKDVENELEKCTREKSLLEKEMNELQVKMQELQEKMAQTVTMKNMKEEEIVRLQSNLNHVSNQITDWELAFVKLAATCL